MDRMLDLRFDGSTLVPGDASGPSTRESTPVALVEAEGEREAAPLVGLFEDIPRSIWTVFLAGWAGFFLLFFVFFAVNAESSFMVIVSMLFGLIAFGLPILMGRQSSPSGRRGGAPARMIQTYTGPLSVRAAGAQIALIPIAVDIGLIAFIILAR